MAERIHDALAGQNPVGGHELVDHGLKLGHPFVLDFLRGAGLDLSSYPI
jgi:hypothetical protein